MRLTAITLAALLVVPLAGCFGSSAPPRAVAPADVGFDPASVHVDRVTSANYTVASVDAAKLAVIAQVPATNDTVAGHAPAWPVVIFLHGWGGQKEDYAPQLAQFAEAGFISIAYDARGFGASQGQTTVAGTIEQSDLGAIIADARVRFPPTGRIGIVGQSYGGGQALLAWANNDDVTTVVSQYGWTDLAAGLIPANVPKAEWAQSLYAYGLVGAKGDYSPMITAWYQQLYTRQDLGTVRKEMLDRSVVGHMAQVTKPLFACQGMQESLFPQIDSVWSGAGGFTRAYVYQGGHGGDDPGCWSRTLDWFEFFLAGFDTRVDSWPALETVDASGLGGSFVYSSAPAAILHPYHLRGADLYDGPASDAAFDVKQTLIGQPASDPSGLWDRAGVPNQFLPDGVRADPSTVSFAMPFDGTLIGAPTLRLHQTAGGTPFQVTGQILRLRADGSSQILSHAAAAALKADDVTNGDIALQFHWVRATFAPGDKIVLRLSSNDESWWMPLFANYDVTFDGHSTLELPFA
ncbi:MAG: alpha/beta fold hydrolase [bacterium]